VSSSGMSESGAMVDGVKASPVKPSRRSKTRGATRSGADVWSGEVKERVSRSRARTSTKRSTYTAPKLVSWTTVFDLDDEDGVPYERDTLRDPHQNGTHDIRRWPRTRSGLSNNGNANILTVPRSAEASPEASLGSASQTMGRRQLRRASATEDDLEVDEERGGGEIQQVSRAPSHASSTASKKRPTPLNGGLVDGSMIGFDRRHSAASELSNASSDKFARGRAAMLGGARKPVDSQDAQDDSRGSLERISRHPSGLFTARNNFGVDPPSITAHPGYHNKDVDKETEGKISRGQSTYTLLQKRGTVKMLSELDVSSLYSLKKSDWRKNRDVVDMKQIHVHRVAAVCGMLGLGCAVMQNEFIILGAMPSDPLLNTLKIANSAFSVAVIVLLYYYYWLHTLFERIVNHLRRGAVLDTTIPMAEILSKRLFWIEALVCGFHIPPFVTFEIGIVQMSNFSMMRVETFGAVMNCLRLYLVARCFTDWILARMPKRHTVATYAAVDLGTSYAFKQLFNGWGGVYYVMMTWTILLGVFGYWFRAAEMTACFFPSTTEDRCLEDRAKIWSLDGVSTFEKENDLYIQNAIWAMLVTSTTVGYGDILANTHFSRAVAGGMGLLGIVLASLLTAALSSALQFTTHEMSALLILQREQARRDLFLKAVLIVQYWWRVRKKKRLSSRQRKMDMFDLGLKFRHKKRETQVEVEDLAADNSKIDSIALRAKYLETAVEAIADKLWEHEMIEDLATQHHNDAKKELAEKSPSGSALLLEPYRPPSPSELKKLVPQSSFSRKVVARVAAHFADAAERNNKDAAASVDGDGDGPKSFTLERKGTIKASDAETQFTFKKGWEWRKKRDIIDKKRRRNGLLSSVFGVIGTVAAIVQNELLIRKENPASDIMNILKWVNCGFSILCAICVFNIYWLNILFARVQAHLRRGQALNPDIPLGSIFKDYTFWIEICLCLCHNPPYYSFEFDITNLDNTIVYRSETLLCIVNTLRCYLLWRVITDHILDTLPRRHTVAMFASVKLGKEFAFKLMLNGWGAIWYIAGAWCFFVVLLGYWFRMFEISACGQEEFYQTGNPACDEDSAITWTVAGVGTFPQTNNIYMWNAIWCIFVTTTTVGYGDIFPTTHLSRVVSVGAAFVGIVCASLLTASLGSSMQPSPQETSATLVLHREKARHELLVLAQRLIAFWWRRRNGTMNRRQRRIDPFELKLAFKRTLLDTQVEVEDCAGISKKIEQIVHRTKYLQRALDAIADKLWEPEVTEMQMKHQRRHRTTILGDIMMQHGDKSHSHDVKAEAAPPRSMMLNRRNSFIQEARNRMMSRTSAVFSASIQQTMFQALQSPMAGDPGFDPRRAPFQRASGKTDEAARQNAFARFHGGGGGEI